MHEIIRKIDICAQQRTGIIEERELFAKMKSDQDRRAREARRERFLTLIGWRKLTRAGTVNRLGTCKAEPTHSADSVARSPGL